MNLNELHSFKLSDAIKFHKELNPKLWKNDQLDPLVRKQLLIIAEDFVEELGIPDLDIVDVTISGSNAAFTWTKHSDLDLHILVNMSELHQDAIYRELFRAKKTLYNDTHDITVHGIPVELYVQDSAEPVVSLGEYSILHDKWIKVPVRRAAKLDQNAAKAKFDQLKDLIAVALKTKHSKKISKALALIKRYRQAGLDKGGEFSPENLAFKAVRSQGAIDALYAMRDKLHSAELTIEEGYAGAKMKFLKPGELRGSFTPSKLMALGFKKSQNGSWFILQSKWEELRKTGQLYEATSRKMMYMCEGAYYSKDMLLEQQLYENFMDSAKQYLGAKYNQKISDVKGQVQDFVNAGIVIKDILSNEQLLTNSTAQIRKWTRAMVQNITSNITTIGEKLNNPRLAKVITDAWKYINTEVNKFTSMPGWKGFLGSLGIYGFIKYLNETINKGGSILANALSSGIIGSLVDQIKTLDVKILSDIKMPDFFGVFDKLAAVKTYLLDVLNQVKAKFGSIRVAGTAQFSQGIQLEESESLAENLRKEFENFHPKNLAEALDSQPYPYEEISSTHHNYIASRSQYIFTTEDNLPYVAMIFKYPGNRIRIEFKSTKQTRDFLGFEVTGTGDARKVFATVIDIVKKYVDKHHPVEISFSAKEPSRVRLYDAFLKRLDRELPDYEGKSGPGYEPDNTYYHLTLKNPQLDEALDSEPYPYISTIGTTGAHEYAFTTDDDNEYEAIIINQKFGIHVSFFLKQKQHKNGLIITRTGITGTGDARRVFATVIDIVKKFAAAEKPEAIVFTASEPSRIRLYDAFVKRLDRELPEYTETRKEKGMAEWFVLLRKTEKLDEATDRNSAIKQILKLQNTQGRSPSEIEASKTLIAKMMKRYNIHSKELRPVERNPYQNRIKQARAERDVAGDMLKAEWDRFKGGIKDKVSTIFKEDFEWQDDPMNWAGTDKDPTPYQGLLRKRVKMSLPEVYPENHKYFIQVFYKNSPTTAVLVYTRNSSNVGRMRREIDFDAHARGEVPEIFWWGDMTLTAEEAFNLYQLQKRHWNGKVAGKSADKQKTKWEPLDEAKYDTMSIEDAQKLWIRHGNASRDADSRNDQVAARVHAKLANDIADKVLNSWDGDTIRSKTILARSAQLFDKYPTPTTTIWEPLDEALDSKPYPYEIEEDSIAWQISNFTTSDRNRYKVFLSKHSNKEVSVEFAYQGDDDIDLDIEDGVGIENTGDARRVFATVIEIVKRYANKYKPNMITFSSDPEEPSRMRLYGALVKRADRLLPDYRDISGEIIGSRTHEYVLARKGYQVNEASGYIPNKKQNIEEIGFANALGATSISDEQIINNSTKDGTMGSRPVFVYTTGPNSIYFFANESTIDALVYLYDGYLKGMKNITPNNKGLVYNLFQYLINIKGQQLKLSPTDTLTPDGIQWILTQINRKESGFKIMDHDGNKIDPNALFIEWESARATGKPGPTAITLGEAKNSNWLRENEQSLMPMDTYGATLTEVVPHKHSVVEVPDLIEASGYIPSKKEANDPRFSTALTVDVKPDSIQKNAKAFGSKTSRAGIPPQARADGKIK